MARNIPGIVWFRVLRLCNLVFIYKWHGCSPQGLGSTSRDQIILLPLNSKISYMNVHAAISIYLYTGWCMSKDGGIQGLCHSTEVPSRHKLVRSSWTWEFIRLILWFQSLRLCPFHNKSLIAHESFRMFVAMDWWLSFSLSACQQSPFPDSLGAN